MTTTDPEQAIRELVQTTVVQGYYERGIAAADRERDRAEKGYTISSAISAGLVAAAVFGNLQEQTNLAKGLGLTAFIFWSSATMLYVWAVSVPTRQLERPASGGWWTAPELVQAVADQVARDVAAIRGRAGAAVLVTVFAVIVTFAAFVATVADKPAAPLDSGTVLLTEKGRAAITSLCASSDGVIPAQFDADALDDAFVQIKPDSEACGAETPSSLTVPRATIAAVSITG